MQVWISCVLAIGCMVLGIVCILQQERLDKLRSGKAIYVSNFGFFEKHLARQMEATFNRELGGIANDAAINRLLEAGHLEISTNGRQIASLSFPQYNKADAQIELTYREVDTWFEHVHMKAVVFNVGDSIRTSYVRVDEAGRPEPFETGTSAPMPVQ